MEENKILEETRAEVIPEEAAPAETAPMEAAPADAMFAEAAPAEAAPTDGKKPLDTASLVLGIVALVAAAFIPLVSYVCGIIGLIFAIRRRKEKRTTAALILCIVGIVGGIISAVLSAQVIIRTMQANGII